MMNKKNDKNKLEKRLKQLNLLESKEKNKLQNLYQQLEIIKTLEQKEIKKLEQIKNTNNNRAIKTIGKIALVGTLTAGAVFGIHEYAKHDAKKKHNQQTEEIHDTEKNNENTTTLPTKTIITEEMLKKNISPNKLDNNITYEALTQTINNIQNNKVREELIEHLKEGKIIEAQEMYGMKRDSKYASNKATGKIDTNTLQRFGDKYFGLYGKEILEHKDIPQEAKNIYQKFLLGEIDNNGAAYMILCKSNTKLYLFNKEHKLIHQQTTLIGKDIHKNQERVPYDYYKTNKGFIYHNKQVNTDTPEGLFLIQKTCKLDYNFICDGPKIGLVALPIHETTQNIEKRYEYNKYEKRFHPIWQPPGKKDKYEKAINSPEIDDNTISHGCPNVKNIGVLLDNITIGKSVEYTTYK